MKCFEDMKQTGELGKLNKSYYGDYTCNSNKCYTPKYAPGPAHSDRDQCQLSNSNPKINTKSSEAAFSGLADISAAEHTKAGNYSS